MPVPPVPPESGRCGYPLHRNKDVPPKATFTVSHRGRCRVDQAVCGTHLPMAVKALSKGCGHEGHGPYEPGVLDVRPIK